MNGFPYFQFHIDRWQAGKISAFDFEEQGLFLHLCILAWVALGAFSICSTTVQRRYRKSAEWIDTTVKAFLEVGIIERDGDKYRIKFIDDQVELLTGKRQQRVEAGKASAAARKAALLSSVDSTDSKQEKRREEKSSTLNERSTSVEHPLLFDLFWKEWPKHSRKVNRKGAEKIWEKDGLDIVAGDVMVALEVWKRSEPWTKNGGEFIPGPCVWLNQRRYEDLDAATVKPTEQKLRNQI